MQHLWLAALPLLLSPTGRQEPGIPPSKDPLPNRPHMVVHGTSDAPKIDGKLDEECWKTAACTSPFVDILGSMGPAPRLKTRVKVIWDKTHLYMGAELEEPHLWGLHKDRDSLVFQDNAFEVFIDHDGDTHNYYELQVNSLGTVWDLWLKRPYRDGGSQINEFNTPGLQCQTHLNGTLNDPSDMDVSWSIELAIPFSALAPITQTPNPPKDGDVWWINFSRVQWPLKVTGQGQKYSKRLKADGNPARESYWVWSPQGVFALHEPESWGLLMFADGPYEKDSPRDFVEPTDLHQRYWLRAVYDLQHSRAKAGELFVDSVDALPASIRSGCKELACKMKLEVSANTFLASLNWNDSNRAHTLRIDQTGHIW